MPASVPEVLAAWMWPFRGYFTAAVWRHALVLMAGTLLVPGRRTAPRRPPPQLRRRQVAPRHLHRHHRLPESSFG